MRLANHPLHTHRRCCQDNTTTTTTRQVRGGGCYPSYLLSLFLAQESGSNVCCWRYLITVIILLAALQYKLPRRKVLRLEEQECVSSHTLGKMCIHAAEKCCVSPRTAGREDCVHTQPTLETYTSPAPNASAKKPKVSRKIRPDVDSSADFEALL